MTWRRRIAGRMPRSLWQQTLLLLLLALALTAIATARPFHSYFRSQFEQQLEKRGRATVHTLSKDYELRPAISLKDATQADPILRTIVSSDEEIVYLAIARGSEIVAVAPSHVSPELLRQAVAHATSPRRTEAARDQVLRFSEKVAAERSLAFMDSPSPDAAEGSETGYVLLGLSSRQAHVRAVWQTLFSIGTSALLVFTVLILLYFRWVAQRLGRMVGFAQATAAGDARATLSDPVADDLGRLAGALAHSSAELQKANAGLEATVAARTAQLQSTLAELWSEMDLARKIQSVLLPTPQQFGKRFDVAGVMKPADEVGGDYFDSFESDGKLWLLIGDVSGHGVSAGLIMMMVQTAVRALVQRAASERQPLSPGQLLTLVNRALWRNLQLIGKGQYMTMTALCIDESGFYYSGLHQHILLYRANQKIIEEIESHGSWIGLLDEIEGVNEDRRVEFSSGDVLMLYTDGLIEAKLRSDEKTMLGLETIKSQFQKSCSGSEPASEIANSIINTTNQCIVSDDIAVLVLRHLA